MDSFKNKHSDELKSGNDSLARNETDQIEKDILKTEINIQDPSNQSIVIRTFTEDDVTYLPGWVYAIDRWEISSNFLHCAMEIDPGGCFIAELPGIGTIGMCIGVNLDDKTAFGGSLCVKTEYRRRGVATLLCTARLEHIGPNRLFGINSVQSRILTNVKMGMTYPISSCRYLVGNVLPSAVSKTLKFMEQSSNSQQNRFQNTRITVHMISPPAETLPIDTLNQLIRYDQSVYGVNRAKFFNSYINFKSATSTNRSGVKLKPIKSHSLSHDQINDNDNLVDSFSIDNPFKQQRTSKQYRSPVKLIIGIAWSNDELCCLENNSRVINNIDFLKTTTEEKNVKKEEIITGYVLITLKTTAWVVGPLYANSDEIALKLLLATLSALPQNLQCSSLTTPTEENLRSVEIVVPEKKSSSQFYQYYDMLRCMKFENSGDIYRMYKLPFTYYDITSTDDIVSDYTTQKDQAKDCSKSYNNNSDSKDIPKIDWDRVWAITHASLYFA